MKLLILTAIFAAVASSPLTQNKSWPWQVGKEYLYDVDTYTWTKFDNSSNIGSAFKVQFIIRVVAPGQLLAKLSQPLYAQIQAEKITYRDVPSDLKYQPIQIIDQPFEIFVEGGRVKSFNAPLTLSVAHENLFKGLISALQVDISAFGHVDSFPNSFDKETFQGLFKKFETDVTGECETLYTVSPLSADWNREYPKFASVEDPVEIIKGKNYDSCKNRTALYYGLPEGAIWNGIAYKNEEKQFIKHIFESRTVAGKQGTILKSEVISSVFLSPLLYGKQKAEVYSYIKVLLSSVQVIKGAEWEKPEASRKIDSLLFTINESMFIPKVSDQSIANAQKLLQDMTPLLQTPSELPKADFLSKFNVLVRIIISLNSEELILLTNSVEIAKASKNVAKAGMWTIYRDAVAQAGTAAAFREIKSWILTKKIQSEEAAEVTTSIGAALRYPTKEIVTEFFELATNREVMEQKFLNNSALLAATKLMRFSEENLYIVNTVIPSLSKYLKKAVEDGDSNKAQVFVRVLGNLARPEILEVFAPYLDGRIAVTKYLRIQMVASLKTLANLKNESVRAVLFTIFKNNAEPYEVRVLAALNLFMAVPTIEMMQIMSHLTYDDPSTQVRAVLANGINFAARLKDPRFADLVKNAQAVLPFVSKEKFGYRLSTDSIIDQYTSDDDFAFFRELSYVGSKDSFLPVYHRSALRFRGTGRTEENQITMSVTGVQQLLDYIAQMIQEPNKSKVDLKFSAKKVAELLNIKREPREPLEGSLFLDNLNQQKLITFNEADLKAFIASTVQSMEKLFKGVDFQYNKILHQKQAYVVFPLAAGVPFFFEYSEPLMFSVNGQVKINVDTKSTKNLSGSLYKNLDITYARNLDGSVGFLDTLGDVYATVGIINKIQFYLPVNLKSDILPGLVKLDFALPEKDATLIHFSVWPYTSLQKTDSLLTISEDPTTKYTERPVKFLSTDVELPLAPLHVQGYSYSSDFDDKNDAFDGDNILTDLGTLMYQKDIALTELNIHYKKVSGLSDIAFSLFYDTLFNQNQSGDLGPASVLSEEVIAKPDARRQEIVKRAASGIKSAEVQLFEAILAFNGKGSLEFVFTGAIADSYVDSKTQGAFFLKGFLTQFNSVFKVVEPKIAPLNFEEALKNKVKVTYKADVKFDNSKNIEIQGFGERREKYTEQLSNDPLAKQCLQETSNGNFFQKDCFKLIMKAHAPDYFKFTIKHDPHYNSGVREFFETLEMLKKFYSWEQEVVSSTTDGQTEIEIQSNYYDHYDNFEFSSGSRNYRLKNVTTLGYYPYAMAIYAPITGWERAYNYYYGYQYMPYCAVDSSKVQTFSGRSYDYSLTSSWHAVMVDESNDFGKWTDLVILARRPSDKQEEVYISYKTEAGKYIEVDIKPTAVEVKSNTNKISEGALTSYWDDVENVPLLQYYVLADGILVFNINNGALRLVYDSQRLIIFTADHRRTTRGICGQSSTEIRDDYITPYGLVDVSELYGASFSLDGEFSDPKTVELKKQAELKAYQPVTKYTNILRSDAEWSKSKNYSH